MVGIPEELNEPLPIQIGDETAACWTLFTGGRDCPQSFE
jgi:hypothetical protein